ncbi:SDR family NAD(P)-dependent oxidoreductase [Paraburkholderia hospita]|uniref:Short-chain dehydrogenase/reductase SDR n=1 Tax=Paraburkholderia hospita TaxID=169430 RepID=A0ABP2PT88_9BURK|nr:SDR family NAD(P)-dependent oxidoreductase [Paraburkholderia hospita]EIM99946.1 short-chain dehydrogenase/reductase SDR [Paraburkholderia hospita]OUL73936.1 oxidoreductase [Paraburkholderia hospita]SEI15584.1 NAD(P)-dependent dehydrogenase, short-chain alcohol dehydrogenase family [Paraburkholderia hospita]
MSQRLEGKVAVITGIGSGMGRAAALLFAAEGARVVGCDVDGESCRSAVALIRDAGGDAVALQPCDPSEPNEADALIDLAIASYGSIDVVYNNAASVRFAPIEDMTVEMWRHTMKGELDIVFNVCKAAWGYLKQRGGSIINCGSVSGKMAYEVLPALAHSAGKGGVIAMTRQLAMEGGKHGIRVNSISPGLVKTGATTSLMDDPNWFGPMKRKLMLNGRVGTPEDIAFCALYLASDEAGWVTGADFAIDGGTTAW